MDITLNDVKQFLKENAEKDEVKSYLATFKTDEESIINKFKESQEFKSEKDRAVSQAIKTYNEKTVPGMIQKELEEKEKEWIEQHVEKPKDPKELKWERDFKKMQDELAERDKKVAERDQKIVQKEIKNTIHKLLGEKKIDIKYANLVPVDYSKFSMDDIEDEENLKELLLPNVETLAAFHTESRQSQAQEMYERGAAKPQNSNQSHPDQLTRDQYNALSPAEKSKAYEEGRVNNILGR